MAPPLGDIAHLGHVELFTPDLDASVAFFTDYLGLTENGQDGDSVYLRTWDDYEHHSLVLTAHEHLRHRPHRPARLQRGGAPAPGQGDRGGGRSGGWVEGEPGLGPLYVTTDPDGHEHELYWESEWYQAPDELRPALKNQPQAKPGKGRRRTPAGPRQLPRRGRRANAEFQQRRSAPGSPSRSGSTAGGSRRSG
jgi:catechol 2,3-dioxygenase